MSRPYFSRSSFPGGTKVRINGKIRAREVRVIAEDGHQLGVLTLPEAIRLAQGRGVDLVEVAPTAAPPVCRLVDYGKFKYEQAKKDKESRKHQHANKMKEVQLSSRIDQHDFAVKLSHAIDFLCEEMKIKVALRLRGREMMHTEYGFNTVEKFLSELAPYGHPDAPPRLIGRGINVILSPLPRNKRAKNPHQAEAPADADAPSRPSNIHLHHPAGTSPQPPPPGSAPQLAPRTASSDFGNNPFAGLDLPVESDQASGSAANS